MANASPTRSGFTFQDCAAMVLFLDFVKDVDSIRVEGRSEDVELYLSDGYTVYAQCKSTDDGNKYAVRMFKDALRTLSKVNDPRCLYLIYVTNIDKPLGAATPVMDFYQMDRRMTYNSLSAKGRAVADKIIKDSGYSIDKDKLAFRIIGFNGPDEREHLRIVYSNIREFIDRMPNTSGFRIERIFETWHDLIVFNGGNKDLDVTLSKKDMVWVFIECLLEDVKHITDEFDPGVVHVVEEQYSSLISSHVERVDFATQVIHDFDVQTKNISKTPDTMKRFIQENWETYAEVFDVPELDMDCRQALISVILGKILGNRFLIKDVKKEAGL